MQHSFFDKSSVFLFLVLFWAMITYKRDSQRQRPTRTCHTAPYSSTRTHICTIAKARYISIELAPLRCTPFAATPQFGLFGRRLCSCRAPLLLPVAFQRNTIQPRRLRHPLAHECNTTASIWLTCRRKCAKHCETFVAAAALIVMCFQQQQQQQTAH